MNHSFLLSTLVPIYRYWNPVMNAHLMTANFNELKNGIHGWKYEGIRFRLLKNPQPGAVPLYRYRLNGKNYFYTTNINEIGMCSFSANRNERVSFNLGSAFFLCNSKKL